LGESDALLKDLYFTKFNFSLTPNWLHLITIGEKCLESGAAKMKRRESHVRCHNHTTLLKR